MDIFVIKLIGALEVLKHITTIQLLCHNIYFYCDNEAILSMISMLSILSNILLVHDMITATSILNQQVI
jgi:hypothetical protein